MEDMSELSKGLSSVLLFFFVLMQGTYNHTRGELTDIYKDTHKATCIKKMARVLTLGPAVHYESGWGQEGPRSVSVHIIQKNKAFSPVN